MASRTPAVVTARQIPVPAMTATEIVVRYGDGDSCLSSNIGWDNKDCIAGLQRMFGVNTGEEIDTITINERGIQATFRRVTCDKSK